jgi:hypothetical protein
VRLCGTGHRGEEFLQVVAGSIEIVESHQTLLDPSGEQPEPLSFDLFDMLEVPHRSARLGPLGSRSEYCLQVIFAVAQQA